MKFCQFPLLTSTPPLSALPAMYSLLAFLQDNRLESPLSSPQVIHGVQQLHAAIVTIPTWSIELGIEPWWQDVPERVPPPRASSASWWSNNLPYSPSATYHPVDFFFLSRVNLCILRLSKQLFHGNSAFWVTQCFYLTFSDMNYLILHCWCFLVAFIMVIMANILFYLFITLTFYPQDTCWSPVIF